MARCCDNSQIIFAYGEGFDIFYSLTVYESVLACGVLICKRRGLLKLNLQKKVLFSQTDFLPWEFLLIKKLEIQKTNTTFIISVLKVVYYLGLVSSNSNFFINKNSQGRYSVLKKSTYSCKFGFS